MQRGRDARRTAGWIARGGVALAVSTLALGCPADPPATSDTSSTGDSTTTTTTTADSTTVAPDSTTGPRMAAPLVDHQAWEVLEAADDPVPNHRPDDVECGPVGAYPEGAGYEIDTGLCNYCARWQPSLVEIQAGDTLAISAFHETLASIEAGQAHLALLLGDWPVWQEFIPIPAAPGVVDATPFNEQIVIDFDVPAGTPVVLHLHNHGYNTWTLLSIEVVPPGQ